MSFEFGSKIFGGVQTKCMEGGGVSKYGVPPIFLDFSRIHLAFCLGFGKMVCISYAEVCKYQDSLKSFFNFCLLDWKV